MCYKLKWYTVIILISIDASFSSETHSESETHLHSSTHSVSCDGSENCPFYTIFYNNNNNDNISSFQKFALTSIYILQILETLLDYETCHTQY